MSETEHSLQATSASIQERISLVIDIAVNAARKEMRGLYIHLINGKETNSDCLPVWLQQISDTTLVIDPGSPQRPAIALDADGGLTYIQLSEFNPPLPPDPTLNQLVYLKTAMDRLNFFHGYKPDPMKKPKQTKANR